MADLVSIFALPQKEMLRNSRQVRLEDLSAKQLAVSFANVSALVSASEIMEIGGEADTWLFPKIRSGSIGCRRHHETC